MKPCWVYFGFVEDGELHVLGLHLTRLGTLEERLVALRATRRVRAAQIVDKLREQGIELARRTVAKYRKILNIPTARQRKQY